MFQFLEINIKSHPRYSRTQLVSFNEIQSQSAGKGAVRKPFVGTKNGDYTTNTSELLDELWQYLVTEAEVLLMPARFFLVERPGVDQTDRLNFFRGTVGRPSISTLQSVSLTRFRSLRATWPILTQLSNPSERGSSRGSRGVRQLAFGLSRVVGLR